MMRRAFVVFVCIMATQFVNAQNKVTSDTVKAALEAVKGDMNGDGILTIDDVSRLVEILLQGSAEVQLPMPASNFAVDICVGRALCHPISTESEGRVTYASSNTDVATVDESGVVRAIAVGETLVTATIAATDDYASSTLSYIVRVSPVTVDEGLHPTPSTDDEENQFSKANN